MIDDSQVILIVVLESFLSCKVVGIEKYIFWSSGAGLRHCTRFYTHAI